MTLLRVGTYLIVTGLDIVRIPLRRKPTGADMGCASDVLGRLPPVVHDSVVSRFNTALPVLKRAVLVDYQRGIRRRRSPVDRGLGR